MKKDNDEIEFIRQHNNDMDPGWRILYQPIELEEFRDWYLMRDCYGKFNFMRKHVDTLGIRSVVDLGCNIGFYPYKFSELGVRSVGVDNRKEFITIANILRRRYSCDAEYVYEDINDFLNQCGNFDMVIYLSTHQHVVKNRGEVYALYLLRRIFRKTNKILFFETGEQHNPWYSDYDCLSKEEIWETLMGLGPSEIENCGPKFDRLMTIGGNFERDLYVLKK